MSSKESKEVEPLEAGSSPSTCSDEPVVIISDNEDNSEDEQDDGCRKKGKPKMDLRGWGGSSGRNVNSLKKKKS